MVKLALLWHMHQPYYEDLATGDHILPWVRLHATKDYWGMVALLDEFPGIRVTFNLVPSLLVQIAAFADERAHDRHLSIGVKAADLLDADERRFLVANGFHAPVERAIRPNARYAELYARRGRPEQFTQADLRDLQVWHKLVWMDPDWLARDPRLRDLVARGERFTEDDKQLLRDVELELLRAVIPAYRDAHARGQVELSSSPFYHPILPLLCDSDTHFRAHPHSVLPRGLFRQPDDAREQVARAIELHTRTFGAPPVGMWPSEGAVSEDVIALLADHGIIWAATDEEILSRSLLRPLTADDLYRPYVVQAGGRDLRMMFRDHQLSDLIGFAYQSWDAQAAAADFVGRVRAAGQRFGAVAADGDEPVVAVILDGENAWEHYPGGGRPFLRALYRELQAAADIRTVTMQEATAGARRSLASIFPGSWINGDFYIWAGHRDDHQAWAQLAAARAVYDARQHAVDPNARSRAYEELLIAEGSDWFWWYGDDHSSDHDREFDDLFRRHVRNVYRALGEPIPDALHVSNITTLPVAAGPLAVGILSQPRVDGRAADFTQWAAAVDVPLGGGGSTMHRVAGTLVQGVKIALDLEALYLRVDGPVLVARLAAGEVHLAVLVEQPRPQRVHPAWTAIDVATAAVPFTSWSARGGDRVRLWLQVVDPDGHVLEQHPGSGPIEFAVPVRDHDATHWLV